MYNLIYLITKACLYSYILPISDTLKEVIQPQVPLRLPCYDFTPVTNPTVAGFLLAVGTPS